MGTRGLVGHIVRGKRKAAYNHWDSYPSQLGVGLVKFIKSLSDEQIRQMIKRLDELEWVDEDSKPSEEDKAHYVAAGLADTTVGGQNTDTCTDFEKDRLFCEWTWFIDWEKKQMTVRGRRSTKTYDFKDLSETAMLSLEKSEYEEEPEEEDLETRRRRRDEATHAHNQALREILKMQEEKERARQSSVD